MTEADLLHIHTPDYLRQLSDPSFIAAVLEIPALAFLPLWLIDRCVLRPMRWATMGTLIATQEALRHGLAVNLSGGYHHARPDHGHGFCAYADIGFAIHELRRAGHLANTDTIIYIDLDAHQGNGVCRTFVDDPRVFIYDQYNLLNFPFDARARRRIDCDVALALGCTDADYLSALQTHLPPFLDSLTQTGTVRLAIYNAGTDVYGADRLGGLSISAAAILDRDRFVLNALMQRCLPTAILLSGGYSQESYRLVAQMVAYILTTWGRI